MIRDFNKIMELQKQKQSSADYAARELDAFRNPAKYKKKIVRSVKLKLNPKSKRVPKVKQVEYSLFLKTKYWKFVKDLVLARDKGLCSKCGSTSRLQVHHLSYVNHFAEHKNLQDLITLCRECHEKEHGILK